MIEIGSSKGMCWEGINIEHMFSISWAFGVRHQALISGCADRHAAVPFTLSPAKHTLPSQRHPLLSPPSPHCYFQGFWRWHCWPFLPPALSLSLAWFTHKSNHSFNKAPSPLDNCLHRVRYLHTSIFEGAGEEGTICFLPWWRCHSNILPNIPDSSLAKNTPPLLDKGPPMALSFTHLHFWEFQRG